MNGVQGVWCLAGGVLHVHQCVPSDLSFRKVCVVQMCTAFTPLYDAAVQAMVREDYIHGLCIYVQGVPGTQQ